MEDSTRNKRRRKEKHTTNSSSTCAVDVMVKNIKDNSVPKLAKAIHIPHKIIVSPSSSSKFIQIVDHEAAAAASNTETLKRRVQRIPLPVDAAGKVVGSSNGFLCIESAREENKFLLWNALIKECKIVPNIQPSRKMLDLDYFEFIGFGHDGCSDDYKIVRFLAYEDFSLEVLVYSLKTNSWRNLILEEPYYSNNIYEVLDFTPRMGTLMNGALYWPVSNFYNLPDIKYQILRFQLADEKHSWVQAPKVIHKYCRLRLMDFEGKLCAYQNVLFDGMIEMWVLKEDQETEPEWTKLMSIPIAKNRTNQGRNLAPICFMKDGEVLLCRNKLSGSRGCRLYNPKNNNFKPLEISGMEGWFNQQFIYEESVESLGPYDGNQDGIKKAPNTKRKRKKGED